MEAAVTAARAAARARTAAAAGSIIATGYIYLLTIGMINYNYITVFGSAEDLLWLQATQDLLTILECSSRAHFKCNFMLIKLLK